MDCLNPETDSGTPIDFKTVVVAFIILAVSCSIAFLILIFERIFHKRKKISWQNLNIPKSSSGASTFREKTSRQYERSRRMSRNSKFVNFLSLQYLIVCTFFRDEIVICIVSKLWFIIIIKISIWFPSPIFCTEEIFGIQTWISQIKNGTKQVKLEACSAQNGSNWRPKIYAKYYERWRIFTTNYIYFW